MLKIIEITLGSTQLTGVLIARESELRLEITKSCILMWLKSREIHMEIKLLMIIFGPQTL
jgi:hypothetical protein